MTTSSTGREPTGGPPLRIGLVISHFHPLQSGAERQALEQGAELVRLGHTVHVLTKAVPGLPRDDTVRGIAVHRWIKPSSLGPLFGLTFVAGLVRGLVRLRPELDLIHTHQGLWEAIGTGVARPWLRDIPTLVQPASSGYYGEAEELLRTRGAAVLQQQILHNTAFLTISEDIAAQWRALGVPSDRLIATASGVDTARFHPGPPAAAVENRLPPHPRVVFTGRLHPQKNLDVLLDAWPAVARQTPAHLVLVGDGVERPRLQTRAQALGIADRVHFAGAVDDPAEHLRAADLFVLPSLAEGMSNSLLEAMATGLPCLASEIGGNTDLIDEGRTGRLLPADEPAAWSAALLALLADPEQARRLGTAALERVRSRYSLTAVVAANVATYRQLLARSGRRGTSSA